MNEPTNIEISEWLNALAADEDFGWKTGDEEKMLRLAAQRLEAREEISEALKIEMIGGNCPVQAEGTIDGEKFYFRARGAHWSMGIGGTDPVADPFWYHCESWGDGPFAAGWMEENIARQLVDRCAADYLRNRRAALEAAKAAMEG